MELKISVDIKGLEQLTKDYPEASHKARYARISEACLVLENRLKSPSGHTPVGAGPMHYRETIFSKVELGSRVEYGVPIWGIVSSPLPYGEPLEYGRRPGKFPPAGPIQHWVEMRFIRFMHTYELKRVDTRPHKEIGNDFFLWEGKYVHESFVSRFWFGWL
ncbi:MAG: hypothetical protein ABH845_00255, partial [Candidatus Omnitrophota bacterium]